MNIFERFIRGRTTSTPVEAIPETLADSRRSKRGGSYGDIGLVDNELVLMAFEKATAPILRRGMELVTDKGLQILAEADLGDGAKIVAAVMTTDAAERVCKTMENAARLGEPKFEPLRQKALRANPAFDKCMLQ